MILLIHRKTVGNKEMLSQVWLNLLDNSIKFTNNNGLISVCVKKNHENIFIVFSDTGIGIAKENISKIFVNCIDNLKVGW